MRSCDLIGRRYGRLVVIERDYSIPNKHEYFWKCMCDCGNEKSVSTGHLTTGTVRSCGCLRKERAIKQFKDAAAKNVKHGKAGTKLYNVWHVMIQRCENPNNPGFRWYGGKGVRVCEEWHDYAAFAEWAFSNGYYDKGNVPRAEKLSIDRIDSSGDYCPENCRWITIHENTVRAAKARWETSQSTNRSSGAKSTV